MARHVQITQNDKIAILQYLKKVVSDKVDFLHADKHKNFLQIDAVIFYGDGQHFQSSQNSKFALSLQYLIKEIRYKVDFSHAYKHQSFPEVDFNTFGIKFPGRSYYHYLQTWSCIIKVLKVINLQYLRKEVRDGVCILHADKHRSFYKLALLSLMELARHAQSTQNRKLVMFSEIGNVFAIFSEKNCNCSIAMQNIQIFQWGPVIFVVTCFLGFFLYIRNTYFQEHQSFFPWWQCVKQEFTFLFLGFFKKLDVLN